MVTGMKRRLLFAFVMIGIAGVVAGIGTYATNTDSQMATQTATVGTVVLGLNGTSADTTIADVTGLMPGDSVQRKVTVDNLGNQDWSALYMSAYVDTSANPAHTTSILDQDRYEGLQMVVERCTTDWTGSNGAWSCADQGGPTTVVTTGPVIRSNLSIATSPAFTATTGKDYLRITLSLPAFAGDEFQGLSSKITFRFSAKQRTATTK